MMLKNPLGYSSMLLCLFMPLSHGEEVLAAIAANFTAPMTEIAADFEKDTGHKVNLTFGSSGKIFAQIQNGAPFDIFLSADQNKPIALEKSGDAVANSRFTYAQGQLALWSATGADAEALLKQGNYQHLSIANPKLAPYGLAATEVLDHLGLTDTSKSKIVMGENISQTWQFVASGNAEIGFVAMSQLLDQGTIKSGTAWTVPAEFYSPIRQDAVLLKQGNSNSAAHDLLEYLHSPKAKKVIENYGYHLP